MRRSLHRPLLALCLAAPLPALALDSLDNLGFALLGGAPNLDLRLRWERVDNVAPATPLDAEATTIRTRLGYTTGKWNDIDVQLELEDVHAFDEKSYNTGLPGVPPAIARRPVIADPVGTELNQAWVRYSGIPKTQVKAGRMRYLLDNQRFVGNVGWRQNEQTFDGYALLSTPIAGLEINAAHFNNANFVTFTNRPLRANLLNVSYAPAEWLKATAYDYLLDFTHDSATLQDTQTYGVRAAGNALTAGSFKLGYTAEFARQKAYDDGPAIVKANYYLAEVASSYAMVSGKLGYEVLGSNDGTYGFQTPLATLHAFQGWADLFLNTPATGIRDEYVSVAATVWQITGTVMGHRFEADDGDADYGDEVDASLARPLTKQLSLLAKYAHFNGSTAASDAANYFDTDKFWLQAEFKF